MITTTAVWSCRSISKNWLLVTFGCCQPSADDDSLKKPSSTVSVEDIVICVRLVIIAVCVVNSKESERFTTQGAQCTSTMGGREPNALPGQRTDGDHQMKNNLGCYRP